MPKLNRSLLKDYEEFSEANPNIVSYLNTFYEQTQRLLIPNSYYQTVWKRTVA